jgi:hypothetical protein
MERVHLPELRGPVQLHRRARTRKAYSPRSGLFKSMRKARSPLILFVARAGAAFAPEVAQEARDEILRGD